MQDLTICSVSYDACDYLNLNRAATISSDVDWLVVLNKQKEKAPLYMRTIDGAPDPGEVPAGFVGRASYHHAAALNLACQTQVFDTRYVLFLDPDFFIVPSLDSICEYMAANDLAFFGAPYYVEEGKVRVYGFPVAYCMFVDTNHVDIKSLDFTPTPDRDTGYQIYEKYKFQDKLKYEAVIPHHPVIHGQIATTKKSIQSEYGYVPASKMDQFFWKDKLFGLHCHCKLHLKGPEEIRTRSKAHIRDIKSIIGLARS